MFDPEDEMKINKTMTVAATADQVWKVWAHDFNDAYQWMASVPYSYAVDHGKLFDGAQSAGRTCDLNDKPNGLKAIEQFLDYDEANKTATVRVDFENTPSGFPVRYNQVPVSIVDTADGQSEMTWRFQSHIKPWAVFMWPAVRKAFDVFVGQIMEELQYFVENGEPRPRKQKALAKAQQVAHA